jgi:fumarate reductase flavoprotein subunit
MTTFGRRDRQGVGMDAGEGIDVIVVGLGAAGLGCAILAAEGGARVVAIEKDPDIGGTLHVAGGKMSAAGTRRQRERGIEDSPDLHFEDVMRLTGGTADPVIVRLAVDEAPATLDWLDDLGFPFDPECPVVVSSYEPYEPYSRPRLYWGPGPVTRLGMAQTITDTIGPVFQSHVEAGSILPLMEHELVDLIAESGRVVGVRARSAEGERELRGKAVVLTTGGYGSSPELFAELTPGSPRLVAVAYRNSRGDGLVAARRVGARVRNGELFAPSAGVVEDETQPGRAIEGWARLAPNDRPPREIHVNQRGERFRAEDDPSAGRLERVILEQPGNNLWLVFDEPALAAGEALIRRWDADEIRARAAAGRQLWVADDIAELAARAGIEPSGLVRSVAEWNETVRTGRDDRFGRSAKTFPVQTPPFYAMKTHAAPTSTTGGLDVDGELRVLDQAGDPIPGLYAGGEVIGAGTTMGNAKAGGMVVMPALSMGRVIGRRLAALHGRAVAAS